MSRRSDSHHKTWNGAAHHHLVAHPLALSAAASSAESDAVPWLDDVDSTVRASSVRVPAGSHVRSPTRRWAVPRAGGAAVLRRSSVANRQGCDESLM